MNVKIDQNKITEYLLNTDHEFGKSKALFFTKNGFSIEKWLDFKDALIRHFFEEFENAATIETEFGIKFVLKGRLISPIGSILSIKSIWFQEHKSELIKLVTAYPNEVI